MSISVIIPTLNEKKNIKRIAKRLDKIKFIKEVIFVDDNSVDGTFLEIKKIKKKKFKGFLRKNSEKDLSKSVMHGVLKSKHNYIVVMDGDLQHDSNYIQDMWNKIKLSDYDIVVASRFMNKKFSGNLGYIRSILSNLAINTINFLYGKKTSDPLSGFFICKKKTLINYKNFFFLRGYKILFDVLYNGKKEIKVFDYGITFNKRYAEKSKFKLRIIWLFLLQLLYTKLVVKK
tara:strand:- start:1057 stop:1749 length:693 start_codon:yes stop_codon:yes gene_type:complete